MIGVLPQEISNLSELVSINLSNNFLNGNIPSSWASLQKLGKKTRYFQEAEVSSLSLTHLASLLKRVYCLNLQLSLR